jgi:DNA processing protein
VTLFDEEYPSNLKEIYDPPLVLYVKGTLEGHDKYSVALVGSRRASNYGRETARRLAFDLCHNWFTVVSGLAHGIDSAAHDGALKAEGRTIAVIGSGLNNPYPPDSVDQMEKIAEQGAVISEYSMDTRPDRINFPIRNRIISGLSLGVVVVEAPERSGALITADHALGQNRLVFAVPGRIDAPTFKGNHKLLKQGAKLVESAEDILEEFDYLFPKKEVFRGKFESAEITQPRLEGAEERIFGVLDNEGTYIDEIIEQSGLTPTQVSAVLLQLEMKRLVRQLPGKLFVRSSLYQV